MVMYTCKWTQKRKLNSNMSFSSILILLWHYVDVELKWCLENTIYGSNNSMEEQFFFEVQKELLDSNITPMFLMIYMYNEISFWWKVCSFLCSYSYAIILLKSLYLMSLVSISFCNGKHILTYVVLHIGSLF